MKKVIVIVIVIVIVLVGIGYSFLSKSTTEKTKEVNAIKKEILNKENKNKDGYFSVNSEEFEKLTKESDVIVVNVHVPYGGEIANTDEFIPYSSIKSKIDMLPKDKNKKIAVYCRSGGMSAVAAKTLVSLGYTNVYDLTGGMNAYSASGREVLSKDIDDGM